MEVKISELKKVIDLECQFLAAAGYPVFLTAKVTIDYERQDVGVKFPEFSGADMKEGAMPDAISAMFEKAQAVGLQEIEAYLIRSGAGRQMRMEFPEDNLTSMPMEGASR